MSDSKDRPVSVPRPGLFYGYIIVIAAFGFLLAYSGARSAFGIFFDPMAKYFTWSSAALSSAFALCIVVDGLSGIVWGRLADKLGPRVVLIISGCLIGLGFFLMSRINNIWQMYAVYGILIGVGMGGGFVPIITSVARWFISRRNFMTALVLAGMGIGTLVVSPVSNWLIFTYDWRDSYVILSIAITIIMVLTAQFMRRDPGEMGQIPYQKVTLDRPGPAPETRSYTLQQAMVTGRFWLLFAIFASFGFVGFALTVHIVPHIIHLGISAATGASVLATMGGVTIIGRLVLGGAADRIGNRTVYIIGFILITITSLGLVAIRDTWVFYAFALVFGVGMGGLSSGQAPMVAELFGLKSHGSIFGACGFGSMVGGSIGPIFTGYVFDVTGSYQIAFVTCGILSITGLVLTLLLIRNKTSYA